MSNNEYQDPDKCPYCGGRDLQLCGVNNGFAIACNPCEVFGPARPNGEEALAAWNARPKNDFREHFIEMAKAAGYDNITSAFVDLDAIRKERDKLIRDARTVLGHTSSIEHALKQKCATLEQERDRARDGYTTTLNAFKELKRAYLAGDVPQLIGWPDTGEQP